MAYVPSKSPLLAMWKRLGGTAVGRWVVGKGFCFIAPYFGSIKPQFVEVKPGHVEIKVKNRRSVRNHLKSVHAIAMCNAAELVGGSCMEVSLNGNYRWIPSKMTVYYQKMAKTDIRAICKIDDWSWEEKRDVVMPVSIYDDHGVEVFKADITMHISPKKK